MLSLAIIAAVLAILALGYRLLDRTLSVPRYYGPITDHFDGRNFHNLEPPGKKGLFDFLRWQLSRTRGDWSEWTDAEPGVPPPEHVDGKDLRVTFINHATVLIQTAGVNILTDPIWSERASPVTWAGPKRHRSPGVRFEDLPPIDVVLISHNHYDHLDIQTLVRLHIEHQPHFVTGLGNGAFLRANDIPSVAELDWWETLPVSNEVGVTCVPAKHFSGRGLSDGDRTLWCGYVIQSVAGNIYFAGDTAIGGHLAELKTRFAAFRLVVLPIGAYLPRWFMCPVHLSPVEAVDAHLLLEPTASVAMHFGTFALGDDGEWEPIVHLHEALQSIGEGRSNIWVLEHGEGRDVP